MKFGGKTFAIAGLMLLAMGLEAAVIYWLIPPRDGVNAQAAGAAEELAPTLDGMPDPLQNAMEFAIDSFNCTNTQGGAGSVVHVSFKLAALIANDQEAQFDEAANKRHKTRVKQTVEKVVRGTSLSNLNDPELSTLRRQIREEINKLLGKSYVIEVVINDFRTMEQ